MAKQHRAGVRYISAPYERLAYRLLMLVPYRLAKGNHISKWRSELSEWVYYHRTECECQGCTRNAAAESVARQGYLFAKGEVPADVFIASYEYNFPFWKN